MKNIYSFIAVLVIVCACNNASKVNKTEGDSTLPAEGNDTASVAGSNFLIDSSTAVLPGESVIKEVIPAENLPVMNLQKTITGDNQSIQLTITDLDPGQLRIRLSHNNAEANIRISQIIMPDGSTDGPFGRELSYNASQKGNYTIIISKSNMASGSPAGDISITIEK